MQRSVLSGVQRQGKQSKATDQNYKAIPRWRKRLLSRKRTTLQKFSEILSASSTFSPVTPPSVLSPVRIVTVFRRQFFSNLIRDQELPSTTEQEVRKTVSTQIGVGETFCTTQYLRSCYGGVVVIGNDPRVPGSIWYPPGKKTTHGPT